LGAEVADYVTGLASQLPPPRHRSAARGKGWIERQRREKERKREREKLKDGPLSEEGNITNSRRTTVVY